MANPPALPETALEQAGAVISGMSLQILDPEKLTWDTIEELGGFLGTLGKIYPFLVGDLILAVEERFGENSGEASQLEALFPHSPHTLKNYRWVSRAIPPTRRRDVGFGIHEAVASLEPHERDHWLQVAEEQRWKREEMRGAIRGARERGELSMRTGPVVDRDVTSPAIPDVTGELVLGPRVCPHCGHEL